MIRQNKQRRFKKTIFILCQGKITEPTYFGFFKNENKIPNLHLKVQFENESNAYKFVERNLKCYIEEIKSYDEFWFVFDKDETNNDDFNKAIELAVKKKCKVAYSNQAFELWLIHHFQALFAPYHRDNLNNKLSQLLGFDYSKDKDCAKKVVKELYPKFQDAIENSEKSFNSFDYEPRNPAKEESSTTVFMLAKSIREFIVNP